MDAALEGPVPIIPGDASSGDNQEVEVEDHEENYKDKAKDTAADEDTNQDKRSGNGSNRGKDNQPKEAAKSMDLESEIRDLKAKLAEITNHRDEANEIVPLGEDLFRMPDEHMLEIQRRRFNKDESSDSDSDDYTKFNHRRRQIERVLVRELKDLNREKEMIKDIRMLRRDRDSLKEKEREWERERLKLERARKQLKKGAYANRAEVAGVEHTEETGIDGVHPSPAKPDEDGDAAPTPPIVAMPKLNYVEWSTFKALRDNAEEDSCAIDVLKGEPVIAFDHTNYWWKKKTDRGRDKGDESAKSKPSANTKKKQATSHEQGVLPERIRIHSRQIITFLNKLGGESISTDTSDSVVMLRPYKFLICYEDEIHQRFHKLHAMFGDQVSTAKLEAATAPPDTTTNESTAQDGIMGLGDQEGPENNEAKSSTEDKQDDGDLDADLKSPIMYQQVACLMQFMDTEIRKKLEYLTSNKCDRVSFTDIWYLFKPGDEVIEQNQKQVHRVIEVTSVSHKVIPPWRTYYDVSSGKSDQTPLYIHCVSVDFDGKNIGPVSRVFEIPRFDGDKVVTSLEVYPLRFAESGKVPNGSFRHKLVARGRMFLEVAQIRHMHYAGLTIDARDEVDSQVVVDFEEAFAAKGNTDWKPAVEGLIGASKLKSNVNEPCVAECCRDENIHKDTDAETQRNRDYIASLIPENRNRYPSVAVYPRALSETKSADNELVDEELVIMSYRVFGFVLRSRKWALLDLTFLSSISFKSSSETDQQPANVEGRQGEAKEKQETAFDQLVLPKGHKDMVLSLIAQHFRDKKSSTTETEQVDIVRGKGKGLILLLHGAPGVGKTTTAGKRDPTSGHTAEMTLMLYYPITEGVAEMFQKPLFQITCGDLGTTAKEVEETLERNFTLANRWDCILLLDEADVFLTSRSRDDFIRNGLVAVFLRVLEYYAGILFLTTNRIGDFDEAFASRIHISLFYPPLDKDPTVEIFKLNLRLIRKRFTKRNRVIKIDDEGLLNFAKEYWVKHEKMRWNGRQIRNGCQTALALAEFDAQGGSHERVKDAHAEVKLEVKHLQTVSDAYREFNVYLNRLYGKDSDRRAKSSGIRARELGGRNNERDQPKDDTLTGQEQTPSSSLGATSRQTQPSPGPGSASMNHPTPSPVSTGQVPYQMYYQPTTGQVIQTLQPGPGGWTPQPVTQTTPVPPAGQPQPVWQGLAHGPWQNTQPQQQIPGQGQYGTSQGFGWPAGAPPQEFSRDRNQQGTGNFDFMPPPTGN